MPSKPSVTTENPKQSSLAESAEAGEKGSVPSSIYSKATSGNHIKDAHQYMQQSVPIFISSIGAFLYHAIVEVIAANKVISNTI